MKKLLIAVNLLLLTACSDDPLTSLKDDQISVKYPESFWQKQETAHSALWDKAVKICHEEEFKSTPNCGGVHDIQFFAHPLPYPKYGEGQGFGKDNMPKL